MTKGWRTIPLGGAMATGVMLAALVVPQTTSAQGWAVEDLVQAEVLPGWRTDAGTHMAALHLTLAEGWMTYWRVPGDSGIPPGFDWSGSRNLSAVRVHWPRPQVFETSGLRTIGFEHELVLPLEFTLQAPGDGGQLRARMDLGVCKEVCVPVSLEVTAALPVSARTGDPRIEAALGQQPQSGAQAGLSRVSCLLDVHGDGVRLTAHLDLPALAGDEMAVVELADADVWVSSARTTRDGGRLTAEVDMLALDGGPVMLERSGLRITVLGDGQAVEIRGCPPA
ncbi:MAG: protein-disulfide reductase DsbD domain-containing protein [Alkalilacustris sp.]